MKLVYICRKGFKNGGLSARLLTGQTEDLGAKNNKETYILLKRGDIPSAQVRKAEQWIVFLKRGSFGAAHVEKVESLGVANAEKWGAFVRHIPVLYLYGSISPHPPGHRYLCKNHFLLVTCQHQNHVRQSVIRQC